MKRNDETRRIISELRVRLLELYGDRLNRLILYGSSARGEANTDSDLDLVVVLKGAVTPGEEIDRMIDIITELNLKYEVLLSIYPVSEENYQRVKSPLLLNIHKEGIIV